MPLNQTDYQSKPPLSMPESTSRLSFVCVVLWLAMYKIEYWDVIYYFTVHEYVAHQQYIHDFMYFCISVGAEAVYVCYHMQFV